MEWSSRNSEIPHMQISIAVLIILVRSATPGLLWVCFEVISDHGAGFDIQCLFLSAHWNIYVLSHRLGGCKRGKYVYCNVPRTCSFKAGEDPSVKIKGWIGALFKTPG